MQNTPSFCSPPHNALPLPPPLRAPPPPGGGCGVGVGLGWGFGAAFGSNYIIVDPEFGGEASPAAPPKPRWLSQLQQQLRIAKFEHSHKDSAR